MDCQLTFVDGIRNVPEKAKMITLNQISINPRKSKANEAPCGLRAGRLGMPGAYPVKSHIIISHIIDMLSKIASLAGARLEFELVTGFERGPAGLALASTNLIVSRVAQTNPAWDQGGLAIWDYGSHRSSVQKMQR